MEFPREALSGEGRRGGDIRSRGMRGKQGLTSRGSKLYTLEFETQSWGLREEGRTMI